MSFGRSRLTCCEDHGGILLWLTVGCRTWHSHVVQRRVGVDVLKILRLGNIAIIADPRMADREPTEGQAQAPVSNGRAGAASVCTAAGHQVTVCETQRSPVET